jgi:hypothetical protein
MSSTGGLSGGLSYSGFSSPAKAKAPGTTKVGDSVGFDARGFKGLSKACKLAQPELRLKLLRNLRAVGEVVAKDAKTIIEPYSETIPPTIKTQVRGEAVLVKAGGGTVHIAGLFELGNHGGSKSASASKSGVFRHPVFGKPPWVSQPMRPFLAPALAKNAALVDEMAEAALNEAVHTLLTAFPEV